MAFDEVTFPSDITWGATGGPRFNTTVLASTEGFESRNRNWAHPRREWDMTHAVKNQDELDDLVAFFCARNGQERGFRFKDWSDYKHDMASTPTAQSLYPATATGTTGTFQLVKTYSDAGGGYRRVITKPVASTIVILANGTPLTTPGNYTLDETTGIVTVTSGIANGNAMTWTGEYAVPVRFSGDNMPVAIDHYQTYSWGGIKIMEIRDPAIYVPQVVRSTGFDNVRLPELITFGVSGGPGFMTQVSTTTGGHETRVRSWDLSKAKYESIGYALQSFDEYTTLLKFFHARNGRAFGFRYRDWSDYRHDPENAGPHTFATTTATVLIYQLKKTYTSGAVTYTRNITKPVTTGFKLYKNGALQTLTTNYTISGTTGLVTLTADPGTGAVLAWEGEFDVAVRFGMDEMNVTLHNFGRFDWSAIELMELRE